MQLVVPSAVSAAVSILTTNCKIIFHFFIRCTLNIKFIFLARMATDGHCFLP